MKVIEVKDYQEMSRRAAQFIIDKVIHSTSLTLGLATGETPEGVYEYLVEDFRKNKTSYSHIHTVNLDEYVGLEKNHPNSYHFYMRDKLFAYLDIPEVQTHLPNGIATDLQKECNRYESLIEHLGGIDLQLLGIGTNGHIGFNEPGTSFQTTTHVVELTPSTRKANARYFAHPFDVPTHAITMGIATIMKSKQILLLVSGTQKAEILARLIYENIHEGIPASILKKHPNVTIIADEEALALVSEKERVVLDD